MGMFLTTYLRGGGVAAAPDAIDATRLSVRRHANSTEKHVPDRVARDEREQRVLGHDRLDEERHAHLRDEDGHEAQEHLRGGFAWCRRLVSVSLP